MKKLFPFKTNQLLRSLAILCAFLLLSDNAKAQIAYQDINPDLTGGAVQQTVLGTQFSFQVTPQGVKFSVNDLDLNNQRIMVAGADALAIVNAGTIIGPNSSWSIDGWDFSGTIAATDKYVGFRVGALGGPYKYGWFKISVSAANNNWTVKSYGYQNTANTAIAAGDMGNGTGNVAVTGIAVNGQGGASAISVNNGTLQMTATVTPANATNPAVTWSVQNGTGSATISATGLLTAVANGTVTVKATAQDGSNISGTKTVTISGQTVGIADVNLLESRYYPNPVSGQLNLQFAQQETISGIRIYNIAGQVVYRDATTKKGTLISIPTAQLPQGTYILTFENVNGKQGLQKFVKQ